jgi:hypothetical protein
MNEFNIPKSLLQEAQINIRKQSFTTGYLTEQWQARQQLFLVLKRKSLGEGTQKVCWILKINDLFLRIQDRATIIFIFPVEIATGN